MVVSPAALARRQVTMRSDRMGPSGGTRSSSAMATGVFDLSRRSGLIQIADLHLRPLAERHGRRTTISICRTEAHEVEFLMAERTGC